MPSCQPFNVLCSNKAIHQCAELHFSISNVSKGVVLCHAAGDSPVTPNVRVRSLASIPELERWLKHPIPIVFRQIDLQQRRSACQFRKGYRKKCGRTISQGKPTDSHTRRTSSQSFSHSQPLSVPDSSRVSQLRMKTAERS